MEKQMSKTDKATRWAHDLAANVAPSRAGDFLDAVKDRAARWSATAQNNLIDAQHRFRKTNPQTRAEAAAETLRARAALLSNGLRGGTNRVGRKNAALAVLGIGGGVVLGLAVAEMVRRKRLRAREAAQPAPDMVVEAQDAYLAQGTPFEDPLAQDAPTLDTPQRH
jgi:plasmid stabilization system protein ParE